MRGLTKVGAERSLTVLAYNLKRVINILGVTTMVEANLRTTSSKNTVGGTCHCDLINFIVFQAMSTPKTHLVFTQSDVRTKYALARRIFSAPRFWVFLNNLESDFSSTC